MKILFVAADKNGSFSPFVVEQREALINAGVSVASYSHKAHGIIMYIREIRYLRRAIIAMRPDVVHAHFGLTGLMATLAVWGLHTPVVVTYHGCDINDVKLRPFSRMAIRLAAWNIFVSHRQLIHVFGTQKNANNNKNWSIIPCGVNIAECDAKYVDLIWFNNKFSFKNYVLFAGSFASVVKNPFLAKQSVEIYNHNHPNSPVELLELRGFSRAEVVTLMHKCRTLLLTSIREGSPQVVKEAMACGCPIVSVDVGDVAERTNGVKGCYVVADCQPHKIAEALDKSIPFGRTTGKEKLIAEGLDNANVAEKLIEIYSKLVKK